MTATENAEDLCKSKSWVSMRLGLIGEMTDNIQEKIFSGAFPVYPYMYTLRQFMRMNGIKRDEIEKFVLAVSGKKLSVREVEQLAHGYFRGPNSFREQILSGNIALALEQMRKIPQDPDGLIEFERILLKDLELVQKYMQRVMFKSNDPRLKNRAFFAQANLLTAGIISQTQPFLHVLRQLNDRSTKA
jgi:hypothetical protein